MRVNTFSFFFMVLLFSSCEEKMKRVIVPGEKTNSEKNYTLEESPQEETLSIEDIGKLANQNDLSSHFCETEIEKEVLYINEGMDRANVIWLNRGENDEVRIDFRPGNSTKVFKITVRGRDNKFASQTGVRTGMTIDQINSVNGKPVDFFGFNWDFGGAAKFNEGALEDKNIFVYFRTDKKVGKRFVGDVLHSFEEAKEAKLNLYVYKIVYVPAKNNQL